MHTSQYTCFMQSPLLGVLFFSTFVIFKPCVRPGPETDSFEAAAENKSCFEYKTKILSIKYTAQEYKTSTTSTEVHAVETNTTSRKSRALFARKDSKALLHMPHHKEKSTYSGSQLASDR